MLIVILFLTAVVAVYCIGINRFLGLPSGPPPLPLIGNMLSFDWDLDKVLLGWKALYGPVFTVWLPNPIVVIGDHRLLQEHLVKNSNVYLYKKNPEQLLKLWFGGNYGLAFQDDHMVKEQRRFALKSLHEIGYVFPALEDAVHNFALEVVGRWRKSDGAEVDVTENIAKVIGNVVWKLTFGIDLEFDNELVPQFRQIQQAFLPLIGGPLMMIFEMFPVICKFDFLLGNHFKRLEKLLDDANRMVEDGIKIAEKSFNPDNQPSSYVDAFLRERKRLEDVGKPIGNFHSKQLLASASALWVAGFDTTVGTLRLCILECVNHPDVQRKIQKEIDDVVGGRRIRFDDQKLLPYVCAFLQEVYRLGNVLPINFLRKTTQDTVIEGRSIAAGTAVLPQFSMVHANPIEFDRPDYFCPERHLDGENRFVKDPRITPFSVGARACIGETQARMEIFVLFATFVQNCHFTPVGKVPPRIEFTTGLARSVKHFVVKIDPRN